jgi:hypothetical protein
MSRPLKIITLEKSYAICRLAPDAALPDWAVSATFCSVTRTKNELSIVCEEERVPVEVKAERNRRVLRIEGPLAFELTGVLASVVAPLANAGISIFSVATYDTDYLLVSEENLVEATRVLEAAGHEVRRDR